MCAIIPDKRHWQWTQIAPYNDKHSELKRLLFKRAPQLITTIEAPKQTHTLSLADTISTRYETIFNWIWGEKFVTSTQPNRFKSYPSQIQEVSRTECRNRYLGQTNSCVWFVGIFRACVCECVSFAIGILVKAIVKQSKSCGRK